MQITVIGSGEEIGQELYAIAYDTGAYLADNAHIAICGGKGGVMEAVSKGVHDNNGICIGILPESTPIAANKYLRAAIPTGIGELRNGIVVASGELIVAFPGSYGTLSEISFALKSKKRMIIVKKELFAYKIDILCKDKAHYAESVEEITEIIREYNDIRQDLWKKG